MPWIFVDKHFASVLEISLVEEKAMNANVDVRIVRVSSLAPKRCACNIAGTPTLRNKKIDDLIRHFDSTCPISFRIAVL